MYVFEAFCPTKLSAKGVEVWFNETDHGIVYDANMANTCETNQTAAASTRRGLVT